MYCQPATPTDTHFTRATPTSAVCFAYMNITYFMVEPAYGESLTVESLTVESLMVESFKVE